MPGTGVRAVSRVGRLAAPTELPFILGMETGDRRATRQKVIMDSGAHFGTSSSMTESYGAGPIYDRVP